MCTFFLRYHRHHKSLWKVVGSRKVKKFWVISEAKIWKSRMALKAPPFEKIEISKNFKSTQKVVFMQIRPSEVLKIENERGVLARLPIFYRCCEVILS